MLSYEMCVALKDAGFPQCTSHRWLFPTRDGSLIQGLDRHREYYGVDRPNSDELIAAICERWPEINQIHIQWSDHYGWHTYAMRGMLQAGRSNDPDQPHIATPVEALAALYLALAAKERAQ